MTKSIVQALEVHYKAVGVSIASENQRVLTRRVSVFDVGIIRKLSGSPIATGHELSKFDWEVQKVGESVHNVTPSTLDRG